MENKEGEMIQEDQAERFTSMNHVDSIEDKVQALLKSNETDFNAWVLLIAEVENTSPDDTQKICLVYDSFLSEFPLCYGYWTRYAGHKARLCTMNDVEEVYEQAVKVASHSVHLWVSYCSFAISSFEDPSDVRRLFERGLLYVDKDYLCHLLWDKYIEFEYCQKQWDRLAHIYINTLRFPTRRLQTYYESFKKLAALLEEQMGCQNATITPQKAVSIFEMTHVNSCGYSEISNAVDLVDQSLAGPEALKKYLSIGELLYHNSSQLDKSISCYEAQIQRQYFHIKPLDDFQIENWHKYLTFVEEQGNFDWTVKLYERCLIPCANYSEFWIRYVDFVDAKGGREIANDALERALKVFLKRIPAFHQYYSLYKEKIGDAVHARTPFLQISEGCTTDVLENVCRKANMEKRMGNIEAAQEIFDKAIKMAHEKQNLAILPLLYINFARFTFVVTHNVDAAMEVFSKGIQQNPCKLIIEGFLDFITMHGGMNHVDSVDCKMATLLLPESDVSHALSFQDRVEISQLYLKFIDLYGTIDEIRMAWERHRKLFPHIMRPSSICHYSSNGSQIRSKKTEGTKSLQTNSPNNSSENPSKTILVKHLVENHSPINMPTILPEDTLKCELKSYAKADNEKTSQKSLAAEPTHIHEPSFPGGSEVDIINKVNDSENMAQIPDISSEFHKTEIPTQESYMHIVSHGNLEPPALDNLSISSADHVTRPTNKTTSHDNNAPQQATSKESGNKFEGDGDDGEASVMHSSGEKILKSGSDSLSKLQEDSRHSHPASHARIKAEAHLKLQEMVNTNQASPVNSGHSQPASGGGQWSQFGYGVEGIIANPNSMIHGNTQFSNPQQWQANGQMQSQSGGTSQETFLTQSHLSRTLSLPNSQDPQAIHTQLQYQLAASQAYTNPGHSFLGQQMQQPGLAYASGHQVQPASSQAQIQSYQNVSQSDEQYGYYQNFQGFSPQIWQYYQNLYYLQQEQLQHRHQGQQMNNSYKKDSSEARSSQPELLENKEERFQLQVQVDAQQQHRDSDEKLNATRDQQNQQEQEGPTQPDQQSLQVINSEQSQLLYLQQQQHYYLQQQQHYQMYLQQQHLLQHQQQQLLLYQQQQLQLQHQPKQLQQQQQSPYPQQQHQSPLQQ